MMKLIRFVEDIYKDAKVLLRMYTHVNIAEIKWKTNLSDIILEGN